ncbi:MAG: TonB-dependent hemoglobin/transferrin/lactoferrin receptor family protein [Bryobacterales bacterium]|nr:TonB-dependent hemoglobin/transferrin/lactoferrin receptor family protein [Bryobacterales bacterium]
MRKIPFIAARVLVAGIMVRGVILAQTSGGVFRGEVRDGSKAVIPQAKITIRSKDNGTEAITESNGDGLYLTPTLIPGSYVLTATKPGFKTELFGPVALQVNNSVRVDFTLDLGAVSDSVQVLATAVQLLALESAEVSQVIASKQVSEIPLNGRSWQQLIALSAGVNPGAPGESGSPNPVNVNGQRAKANLFLVDGISTTSSAQGRGNNFNIPLEAVREFSVQSGSYSAEFGDVAGGVINLESKSGTNDWHGSMFEFFRNDKMDAANFFSNATGQAKNPLRYNQFGGSLGGPIRRDRTFLFADYQGTITHNSTPMVASLPLSEQRQGDFSNLRDSKGTLVPIYDPFGPSLARQQFPGNVIPLDRIDRAAAAISALLPQPNQFDAAGRSLPFNNYAVTRPSTSGVHSFDIRVDHQFSPQNTLFVRNSLQDTAAVSASLFGLPLGGPPTLAGTTSARTQNTGLGYIHQFSPTLINESRIGLTRQANTLTQEDYGQNLSEQFGIPGVNRSPETSGLSGLVVSGLFSVGGSILTPLRVAATDWNFSEKITWVKGRHTLRFGVDDQYEMGSTGYLVFGRGNYTFLNLTTSTAVGPPGGNAYASFLTGSPFLVLRDQFPPGMVGLISSRYGFYVQDDIKLTSKLTVNIGARYDIMPYAREMYDRLSNFDPATRTMLLAGKNTSQRLRNTDYKNVAPRIGLALAPGNDNKTVIRAGYGIGFVDPVGSGSVLNSNEFNIPFYFRDNITQFPFTAPTYTLSNRLPELVVPSPTAPTGDQRYLVPTDRNQYSQTWSLSVQRGLNSTSMVEIAYVGTSGNRLLMSSNINAAPPGLTNPVTRRPFGSSLGDIRELSNSGHSAYHGLQSKIERRFSHGLYFLGSYTWSKSLDNQSNGTDDSAASGQYPQDPRNRRLDRGLSSFDRTHRFAGSAVWEIPFGHASTLAHGALGGWQLSGIFAVQTGSPFSVLIPCATINAEGNNCRPDRATSGELPSDQRSISHWFDVTAFSIPSPQAYGNAGRNILRGPGSTNLDLALSKSFRWEGAETRRLQIRSEFFNALNHTNFGLPVHSMDSPALGTITSAAPARIIQLGARLEF